MKQQYATPQTVNFVFFVVYMAGLSAFGSFVNDLYLPSLPEMTSYFSCSVSMVQLGLTTGMVGLGLGQLILGPISDKYGRKRVLGGSILLFVGGAIISVFAPTIHLFLLCRFVQGLGASGGYFLARTIPADIYGGRQLAKTMAIIGAINGIAPASAPVLGGFISDSFTWKGVFVFLAIIATVLLIFSMRLKESLPPDRRTKGSLVNAFKAYGTLLRNKRFMIHTLLKGSALGVLFAYISSAPFIMQTHYGFSEIHFGLIMGGNALMIAAGSMLALRFKVLKRASTIGALILLVSVVAESAVLWWVNDFLAYELLLLPTLFSLGMIFTMSNTLAMNEGRNDAGGASAIVGVSGYVFGASVAPLVGIGNILHSTAIVMLVVTAIVVVMAMISRRFTPDL